ncbi:helix-turn-helix domain-containing protein [Glycomyces sp. NPDC047369]
MPEALVNLRPLRLRAMMSQEELALKAGVGTRTVRDIESGRVRPQPKTLRLIADALGLDEQGLAELNGATAAAPEPPAPVTLPSATAVFTGRTSGLAALDAAPPLVVLTGVGGVGKTMLALHWGHRSAERFPGGRLYIDLRGFGPGDGVMEPAEAIRHLLASLGVEQRRIPADPEAQVALYRSVMSAGRRLLILDNARDAAQVRPLLPDAAQTRTVVVSRRRLVGLAASHGARVVEVEVFDRTEAAELLERQLGAARMAAEPEAAQRIADLCTGLPLALAIAGARAAAAPGLPLAAVAEELERSRLDALAVDEDSVDLRAVFSWSYRALDPDAARLFRLLSLIPGPDFGPDAAAALHGGPAAAKAFRALVEGHLVEPDGRGRFRLHDLIRLYAAELRDAETPGPERDAALDRLLDWYLQSAGACRAALYPAMVGLPLPEALHERPAPQDPAQWLAAEWKNLCAAVEYAAAQGRLPFTWLMADVVRGYAWLHMLGADGARLGRAAADAAAEADDPLGRAAAAMALGCGLMRSNRHTEAIEHLRDAASYARQAGWSAGAASAEGNLSVACYHRGRMREGLEHAYAALHAFREIGETRAESTNLNMLGLFHSLMGDLATGVDFLEQALKLTTAAENGPISVILLGHLAEIEGFRGRLDVANARLEEAAALLRATASIDRTSDLPGVHARLLLAAGRTGEARELAAQVVQDRTDEADHRIRAAGIVTLAAACDAEGDAAEAVGLYDRVLAMTEHDDTVFHRVEAMVGRASAMLHNGDTDAAEAAAAALQTARDAGYRFLEGRALNVLAAVDLEAGRPAAAVDLARDALLIHRETGHGPGETESLRLLAEGGAAGA